MLGNDGTGVASYARVLLAALHKAGAAPSILGDGGIRRSSAAKLIAAYRPWPIRTTRSAERLIAPDVFRESQVRFSKTGKLRRLDVHGPVGTMHWTYPVPLRVDGWRNLYTVHDSIPLTDPALTPIDPQRHRRLLLALLESGGEFVSVTTSAARATESALGLASGALVNLGQAVDAAIAGERPPLTAGLVAGCYFLAYGTVEPRKNLVRLAEAHLSAGTGFPLVVAGPDGWQFANVSAELRKRAVIRLPYLDRPALLSLVANARAVLFPSLAEGFGLPIAEAMTLGTPVMTSKGGATEEVAGDAALLTDPLNADAMSIAIARLAIDDAFRSSLIDRGRRRAALWTIESFSARLSAFYQAWAE